MNLLFANDKAGSYPPSYYAATANFLAPFAPLRDDTTADICVIGAGYTGLSAALHLAKQGFKVIVLEAHRVGFGASGRNGGQVGSGQRLEQDVLEKMVGPADARKLWDLGESAKTLVRDLIQKHAMDCRFQPGVLHADWQSSEVRHSHAYAEKLARDYDYPLVEPLSRDALQAIVKAPVYQGGALDMGAGHINPLRFALGLARAAAAAGVTICEQTHALSVTPGARPVVQTQFGKVRAEHVILAANGYLGGLDRKVAAKVMPINNFILATEPLGDRAAEVLCRNVAVADSKFVVNYFRLSEDGRMLFGGGESYGYRFPDIQATVRKPMLQVFPQLADTRIDYAWGGTLAITMNRLPCFARPAQGVYSASGYSGHGVAMATLAGRIIADALHGDAVNFDLLARLPMPGFPGGSALRSPLLVLAMTWFSLRDRLGF
jgi:gamma-glutamylputrescine oxidase